MSDDMKPSASPSPECELVEGRLADYLDDAPDPALVAEVDAHLARCQRCAALVGDLTGIATAARALPPLEPARDLWAGIADRIAAAPTVVPIETARRGRGFTLPARWRSLGAAAAALVLVTAGVTYTVTRTWLHGSDTATPIVATTSSPTSPTSRATDSNPPATPAGEQLAVSGAATTPGTTSAEPVTRSAIRSGDTKLAAASSRREKPTYDHEIATLRGIVRERRSELDPKTLSVLEHNIQIIDDAIAQSRAALARDPRSRFLGEQLDDALDKKLELLRTAALLPART